jgi:hypothetical protein
MRSGQQAVVVIAALDLRRAPDHRSEMRSQLLLGELVRIVARSPRGHWAKVENVSDGYRGWVRTWGLKNLAVEEARAWAARARWRVVVPHAELRPRPGAGSPLSPAFWNARLAAGKPAGSYRPVELPDGRRGWIDSRCLRPANRPAGTLRQLLARFEGVPYLWGGRTPSGFDCSGFVQQVLCGRGIPMPRDAHEQFLACEPLARERSGPGDLVFFGRSRARIGHVGILRGGTLYVHARGTVRVASFDRFNPLCDKDLLPMIRGFGRPPAGGGPEGHSC